MASVFLSSPAGATRCSGQDTFLKDGSSTPFCSSVPRKKLAACFQINDPRKSDQQTISERLFIGTTFLGNKFLGRYINSSCSLSLAFYRSNGTKIDNDNNIDKSGFSQINAVVKRSPKRLKYASDKRPHAGELLYVAIDPLNVDSACLESVATELRTGAIGVIPTDTVYAIVCDLRNRSAVERLYRVKNMDPKKPLSILCRNFQDIDTYTLGFPRGNGHGQSSVFRAARQCLPGPYTFILKASKEMPKQCVNFGGSLAAQCAPRKSVGVRMPQDSICQALLLQLDEPLLCTSVTQEHENDWLLDPSLIAETYGSGDINERVDFIVDAGLRVADPSTVIDMTGDRPVVLRRGKGMLEDWMATDSLAGANPYARA